MDAEQYSYDVCKISAIPECGFFSCCCVILENIVYFFNKYKKLPKKIELTNIFDYYKYQHEYDNDIYPFYFKTRDDIIIPYTNKIYYTIDKSYYPRVSFQNCDYSKIDFATLCPFIKKYFTPTDIVMDRMNYIINKYNFDFDNTCVLFHRGNDKAREMELPKYEQFINHANDCVKMNPHIRFFIQSDETEFITCMLEHFPNAFACFDEIRHINKCRSTVDLLWKHTGLNREMSVNFLAIMLIMSKCKYVVATTGNCPLWIRLFRGNNNGVITINPSFLTFVEPDNEFS